MLLSFRKTARSLGMGLALCGFAACAHEVESPGVGTSAVTPDIACNAQISSDIAIDGNGFTPMPTKVLEDQAILVLPTVALTRAATLDGTAEAGATVVLDGDPAGDNADNVTWQSSSLMTIIVDEPLSLEPGLHDVEVTNPDGEQKADLGRALAVVPPPHISELIPPELCNDQSEQTLVIVGETFLRIGDTTPTVRIESSTLGIDETFQVTLLEDCTPIPDRSPAAEMCTSATIVIPAQTLGPGDYDVTLTNPPPADCTSTDSITLTVNPPPEVTAVVPAAVCTGGSIVVAEGTGFQDGATAELRCPDGAIVASTATDASDDGTQITITFGPGVNPGEECDLVVVNPDGCEDRPIPHKTVVGTDGPILFFSAPPVVYNGVSTKIELFVTSVDPPFDVVIRPAGMAEPETMLDSTQSPGRNNRLQATVPAGQAAGLYDVVVADATGCFATLPEGLEVVDQTTLNLTIVTPSYGDANASTAVTIFSSADLEATPLVFLNPSDPNQPAIQLQGVSFVDASEITAVVPDGTAPGTYDIIVVNPSGGVGVIDGGFTVVADPPPVIDAVSPQSITSDSNNTLVITGSSFRGSTVAMECTDSGGSALQSPTASEQPETCVGEVCTQTVTVDAGGLPNGAICKVVLTNGDGSFGEFSAVGVTNSSLNLQDPVAGTPLNVARRALVSAAVRSTSASRFVYAIAGDEGPGSSPLASVEFSNVGIFGGMSDWTVSAEPLAQARAFAGSARVGRYIYVFGGSDGSNALDSGERALVLSPEEAPQISDLDLCLGGRDDCFGQTGLGAGLAPGLYSYRVAALIDSADSVNLGGETLASDPISLKLETIAGDRNILVNLLWAAPVDSEGTPLTGVTGYRIYRTPADGIAGVDEVLLGEVDASSLEYVDDGSATLGTAAPLPSGSTSAWQGLPAMTTVRSGAAGAAARDPSDPDTWYIYALLGKDGGGETGGNGLASHELLTVSVQSNGRQTVGTWTAGNEASSVGRWQIGAWTVDDTILPAVGADTRIFVGGGRDPSQSPNNDTSSTVEVAQVLTGGQLGAFDGGPDDMSPARAGFAAVPIGTSTSAKLLLWGGLQSNPTNNAIGAELLGPTSIANWNNEGLSMQEDRYLAGSSVQSAFVFLIGGQTSGGGAVTASTELVVW